MNMLQLTNPSNHLLFALLGIFMSALLTYLVCKLLIRAAPVLKLIDSPAGHKRHLNPTPVVGGIAVFLSLFIVSVLMPGMLSRLHIFWYCVSLLVLTGLLDDMHDISAKVRLLIQISVSLIMIFAGGVLFLNLPHWFGYTDFHLAYFTAVFLTIFVTLGFINANNMIDGLDGLLSSIVVAQFLLLLAVAFSVSDWQVIALLSWFVGSLIAFLCFNFPKFGAIPAKVFLGDAGSMPLGFVIAFIAVHLSQQPHVSVSPIVLLWIFTVQIYDIAAVILRRLINLKSPFTPDNHHVHHLLMALGVSRRRVPFLLFFLTITIGGCALLASYYSLRSSIMFDAYCIIFFAYFSLYYFAWNKIESRRILSP